MLSRRKFARGLLGALAGFTVLPAATTYNRLWKAVAEQPRSQINPEWVNAPYEMDFWFADPIHIGPPPPRFKEPFPRRYIAENGVFREVLP